ncbi:hypothetical protein [Nocardia sp. NPDC020380]|uniref:hypothetical protein n=1 Tax=Nocardia sp. NPDC020380 TaxID=3364309 RepID=UPI0037A4479D
MRRAARKRASSNPTSFAFNIISLATLTLAGTVGLAGTAQAESVSDSRTPSAVPTASPPTISIVRGSQSGVAFLARTTPDGQGVVTALDSGSFAIRTDLDAVTITNDRGRIVAAVPLTVSVADHVFTFAPTVTDNASTLTLRSISADNASSKERWDAKVQRATFGALVGAGIGAVLGIPVFYLVLPPLIGAAIGASIGFLAVGGQPLLDAGIAYFTGQP